MYTVNFERVSMEPKIRLALVACRIGLFTDGHQNGSRRNQTPGTLHIWECGEWMFNCLWS